MRQFKLFFSNFAFVTSSSFIVTFKAQAQDITLNTQEQKHVLCGGIKRTKWPSERHATAPLCGK